MSCYGCKHYTPPTWNDSADCDYQGEPPYPCEPNEIEWFKEYDERISDED